MRSFIRRTTTLALLGALAVGSGLPAAAQSGQVQSLSQRQSILTELSSTGEAGTSRVFTQLKATGSGEVAVTLPQQSTRGLRNLEGFGKPDVNGDDVVWTLDASKDGFARSVADNTAELPVSVSVVYRLDGQEVAPKDLAGRTGKVEVEYTVRNLTAEPRDVISFDAENNKFTETMDVAVPMVGSLSLTLPVSFANIDAPGGVTVGDGRGNTVINYSLLLFAPLGSEEQTVTWSADAVDTAIPETSIQVLPVDDTSFTSLNATADAYKGASNSLSELANGALIINSNLLLLGSGASQLLDGLNQLADGAGQLNDGLANTAAPGARQLSDGMTKAREGGGKLSTGLGELALGATRLSDGLGAADAGGAKLRDGLGQLAAGATRLSDGLGSAQAGSMLLAAGLQDKAAPGARLLADGLTDVAAPGAKLLADGLTNTAAPGAKQINAGLLGVLAALGGETDSAGAGQATLIGGLNDLIGGVQGLIVQLTADDDPATARLGDGTAALRQLNSGLYDAFGPDPDAGGAHAGQKAQAGADGLQSGRNLLNAIRGSGAAPGSLDYSAIANEFVCLNADCSANATVEEILNTGKAAVGIPAGGVVNAILGSVQAGLQDNADSLGTLPASCDAAKLAVGTAAATGTDPDGLAVILAAKCIAEDVDNALITQVIPGLEGQLLVGLTRVRGGVSNPAALDSTNPGFNPSCTPATAANGLQPCGLVQALTLLEAGSDALAVGLHGAADGANRLSTGIAGAASGADELATGISDAADGSGALADGIQQLDDGGKQLADGADAAATGSKELGSGLGQLADGGGQLAAGAGAAASGSRDLASGLVQLDDGALKLANGLGDAADGSGKLAEGLVAAEEGGAKIADGTGKLQEGFEERLIGGVSAGRQGASQDYEQVKAVIARGREGAAPYGIADGADATTVFQFDLAGVGTEEGPSTLLLVVLALAALGAAGGLGLALRRRLTA